MPIRDGGTQVITEGMATSVQAQKGLRTPLVVTISHQVTKFIVSGSVSPVPFLQSGLDRQRCPNLVDLAGRAFIAKASLPHGPDPWLERAGEAMAKGLTRQRMRKPVILVLLLLLFGSLGVTAAQTADAEPPRETPYRHASGLLVVAPADENVVPQELRDARGFASTIALQNPHDFGFPLVRDGRILLPVTSERTASLADATSADTMASELQRVEQEFKQTSSAEPGERLELDSKKITNLFSDIFSVVHGSETWEEIENLNNEVFDLAVRPEFDDAWAWGSEIDPASGRIILTVERLTESLSKALVESHDTETVVVTEETSPNTEPQDSRNSDTNPFYGGARIYTPAGCSAAFAWSSSGTYPMLSAGHCAPNGTSTVTTGAGSTMGKILSGSRENWTNGVGTVLMTGATRYRGDISLIRMAGSSDSWARMWRGGVNSTKYNTVKDAWVRIAERGDRYCVGGASTGENCGYTVIRGGPYNHRYSNGTVVRPAVLGRNYDTSKCTASGDSGGPIFTIRSDGYIQAKGVHSGGTAAASYCVNVFTDIYHPITAWPGTVKLG